MTSNKVGLFNKRVSRFDLFLCKIPLTYMGILTFMVGKDLRKILDVGAGTGVVMSMINSSKKLEATGLDIYQPYLDECKKRGVYKKLIRKDVREMPFKNREFEVVMCLHVVEHLSKQEGKKLIRRLENVASKRVVLAMPIGNLPQDEYDGNIYQRHRSAWYPNELRRMGYTVVGQGLKFLYRDKNAVLKYGKFSYVLFLISTLLQPLLFIKPELGIYMLCRKEVG